MMEETPYCPLCGQADNAKRFTERHHDLRACKQCGLLFIHPYPHDEAVRHQAVKAYTFSELDVVDTQRHYAAERQYYRRYYPLIKEECAGATSFLDVGCGTGHLLELLREYPSLIRMGIELNNARAEMAEHHAQSEIFRVPIEHFHSSRTFDVISMINVLSHIASLDHLFAAIDRLLSPHGKLIIKTGEVSDQVNKDDIFDWGIPDHLLFCGLQTMPFICKKYGYCLTQHRRIPYSAECFARTRWLSPGGSALRNAVKFTVAYTPGALAALSALYDYRHGGKIFSSFFVLQREGIREG